MGCSLKWVAREHRIVPWLKWDLGVVRMLASGWPTPAATINFPGGWVRFGVQTLPQIACVIIFDQQHTWYMVCRNSRRWVRPTERVKPVSETGSDLQIVDDFVNRRRNRSV